MTNTPPSTGPDPDAETGRAAGADTTTTTTTATATRADSQQELVYDDTTPPPGRPVRLEPTPPGFWPVLGGGVVAVLAPFFGILIGSTMGADEPASRMDPLYWGFFLGCVVGAFGLVSVGLGARQLMRNPRKRPPEEEEGV